LPQPDPPGDKRRPLILITNDDGIRSPGLLAAACAAGGLGQLLVVAPAGQQTGMGRSMPPAHGRVEPVALALEDGPLTAYAVPGTPAQAVSYALLVLAGRLPDLAIVGINHGENLGSAITSSGTIGAALEAASAGVPAIAVSLETDREYHFRHGPDLAWAAAAEVTRRLARLVLSHGLPPDVDILKADIPADAGPHTPWRVVSQSRQAYWENYVPAAAGGLPALESIDYRLAIRWETLDPDSDIHALVRERAVSVVPLSIDMTSRVDLRALSARLHDGGEGES
jgi:5'-nucleotidase